MADQRDTFGNQMQHTDQYGNPVPPSYTDLGGDTAGHDSTAAQHGQLHAKKPHGATGILHRSGSSSSSSSEEDGMGGRRKKGLKDKVKEKIPGGHKTDDQYGRTQVQQQHQQPRHEKPGMMEKVKEKIPGVHQTDEYGRPQAQQEPHTQVPQTHVQPEKKGMVEKIKEKIPGGH